MRFLNNLLRIENLNNLRTPIQFRVLINVYIIFTLRKYEHKYYKRTKPAHLIICTSR